MNALLVVFCIFSMSLIGAWVLFKLLENTAVVKLPFGTFSGAVAGFFGIYFLLNNSYNTLQKKDQIDLKPPDGFYSFVSQDYHFGFCYPKELKLYDSNMAYQVIKQITFPNQPGGINEFLIGVGGLQPNAKDFDKTIKAKDVEKYSDFVHAYYGKEISIKNIGAKTLDGKTGLQYSLEKKLKLNGRKKDIFVMSTMFIDLKQQLTVMFVLQVEDQKPDDFVRRYNEILSTVRFFN